MKNNLLKKISVMCVACLVFMFTLTATAHAAATVTWTGDRSGGANVAHLGVNNYVGLPIKVDVGANGSLKSIEVSIGSGPAEISGRSKTYTSGQSTTFTPKARVYGDGGNFTLVVKVEYTTRNGEQASDTITLDIQNQMDPNDSTYNPEKHAGMSEDEYIAHLDEHGVFNPDADPNTGDDDDDDDDDGGSGSGTYGDPDDLINVLSPTDGVGKVIFDFAIIVAMILTFLAVLFVGVNIIMARGNGEQRSSSMQGLMYIVIGVIILDIVLAAYGLINGLVGDPESEVDQLNVTINN